MSRSSAFLFNDNSNVPYLQFQDFLREMGVRSNSLLAIDADLQEKFFPKNEAGQPRKRWDLPKVGTSCTKERFHRHLALCGFYQETIPMDWYYTYAGWPGALVVRAGARLMDLITAWKSGVRWNKTIVFAGKRPKIREKETFSDARDSINFQKWDADDFNEWSGIETEIDEMRWLWKKADIPPEMRGKPIMFVDAPMKPPVKEGGQPIRPNSEDTIKVWLETDPRPGTLLLSSGAPYGMAMDEAWAMLLKPRISVETFGHKAPCLEPEVFMREVAGCVHRIARARGVIT
jgi:hypothetical protein